jgi:hypothetical protein
MEKHVYQFECTLLSSLLTLSIFAYSSREVFDLSWGKMISAYKIFAGKRQEMKTRELAVNTSGLG